MIFGPKTVEYLELYVISESQNGPIKIGRSSNAGYRLVALQTGNPRKLRIVILYRLLRDDAVEAERLLLDELKRHALIGEWLSLSEQFIRDYLQDFMLANGFEVFA